ANYHTLMLFFFSSRRRHTRWPRDWSSDVCSSDLLATAVLGAVAPRQSPHQPHIQHIARAFPYLRFALPWFGRSSRPCEARETGEIGRASCRERGESVVGGGSGRKHGASTGGRGAR